MVDFFSRVGSGISSWMNGGNFSAGFVMNDGLVGALMSRDGGFGMMNPMSMWMGGNYGMGQMFNPFGMNLMGMGNPMAMMMMNPAASMYGMGMGMMDPMSMMMGGGAMMNPMMQQNLLYGAITGQIDF